MSRLGVVGAGVAGCLVARRLADAGHDVVVFEAGRRLTSTLDFAALLDDPGAFWPDGQPAGYLRARALGGGSAVNGMLASAPDSEDLAAWDAAAGAAAGSARFALERVIADLAPQLAVPGSVGRALGDAAIGAGRALGGSTLDVDATGVLAAALSARSGERRDAARVYLDDAPGNLEIRSGTRVDGVRVRPGGPEVLTEHGPVGFDHVVCSAGALGSPLLLADLVPAARPPMRGVNHAAVPITLLLAAEHRSVGDVPAVSRVVRWATGIGDERIDAQIVAMDHLGWTPEGRALGLLIVTVLAVDEHLEARRRAALSHAAALLSDPALAGLGSLAPGSVAPGSGLDVLVATTEVTPGVPPDLASDVDRAADSGTANTRPVTVHHLTGTLPLGSRLGPAGLLAGRDDVSVIDGSVLPESPRADTHVPILAVAELLTGQLVHHLS